MSETLIRGVGCPSCGGSLEIAEGEILLKCKYCEAGLMVQGDRGIAWYFVPLKSSRDDVLQKAQKWFGQLDKAMDLKRAAQIKESFPVFIPFWRVNAGVVGWVLGDEKKGSGKNERYEPVERKVNKKLEYTSPACDIGEFGVKWVDLQGDEIRPFQIEEVQKEGMTFAVLTAAEDALRVGQEEFLAEAEASARVDRVTCKHLFVINRTISIVFYPLWIIRYEYKNRIYQITADGEKADLLYGRAPGNNLYRVACLLLSVMFGDFILAGAIRSGEDDIVPLLLLAAAIMLFGFWKFRYGGEVKIQQKGQLNKGSLTNLVPELGQAVNEWKRMMKKA